MPRIKGTGNKTGKLDSKGRPTYNWTKSAKKATSTNVDGDRTTAISDFSPEHQSETVSDSIQDYMSAGDGYLAIEKAYASAWVKNGLKSKHFDSEDFHNYWNSDGLQEDRGMIENSIVDNALLSDGEEVEVEVDEQMLQNIADDYARENILGYKDHVQNKYNEQLDDAISGQGTIQDCYQKMDDLRELGEYPNNEQRIAMINREDVTDKDMYRILTHAQTGYYEDRGSSKVWDAACRRMEKMIEDNSQGIRQSVIQKEYLPIFQSKARELARLDRDEDLISGNNVAKSAIDNAEVVNTGINRKNLFIPQEAIDAITPYKRDRKEAIYAIFEYTTRRHPEHSNFDKHDVETGYDYENRMIRYMPNMGRTSR